MVFRAKSRHEPFWSILPFENCDFWGVFWGKLLILTVFSPLKRRQITLWSTKPRQSHQMVYFDYISLFLMEINQNSRKNRKNPDLGPQKCLKSSKILFDKFRKNRNKNVKKHFRMWLNCALQAGPLCTITYFVGIFFGKLHAPPRATGLRTSGLYAEVMQHRQCV